MVLAVEVREIVGFYFIHFLHLYAVASGPERGVKLLQQLHSLRKLVQILLLSVRELLPSNEIV